MKIFSAEQIRRWDAFTIQHEPISSLSLMERASTVFADWWTETFPHNGQKIVLFCGSGNNGGDGLAVARLLHQRFYDVEVFLCRTGANLSSDCATNLEALKALKSVEILEISVGSTFPPIGSDNIIIDAIFGSGLNRPVSGFWADLIAHINEARSTVVAIDIPSGLFADRSSLGHPLIQADLTLSFQAPKLAFLLPQNHSYVGEWTVRNIGLSQVYEREEKSSHLLLTRDSIKSWLRKRRKFDHKGTFGHALLVVGSYGKMGAAVLAARACLRSGVGLLSIHIPQCGYHIMQGQVPEAMVYTDNNNHFWTEAPETDQYKAIGIGCGIGQEGATEAILYQTLKVASQLPLVLDADALNILAKNPKWLHELPAKSILTPHPKEFERLFGKVEDDFQRLELIKQKAIDLELIIVLKGAYTCIAVPSGECYFNPTGNPGMASGGSGDALTGIICGLLAQGYPPEQAALSGVFLHGQAGDLAAEAFGMEAMLPSDLIEQLGNAFTYIKSTKEADEKN